MGTIMRRTRVSSEREKWDKVFNSFLKLVTDLQQDNETLLQERRFLEHLIKTQHERWVFDVRLLEDQISQMKDNLAGKDKELVLAARRCDLFAGMKQREASLCKLKLDIAEDELADIRALFGYLSSALPPTRNSKESDKVKRLKHLASETSSQTKALLKERSFLWHQYNLLESNLSDKLKSKPVEVEQANEKIAKLLASMELLQSSSSEKDELIGRFKTKLTEMEANSNRWKDEVSKLSTELELLKKARGIQVTPALNRFSAGTKNSTLGINKSRMHSNNVTVKKEMNPVQANFPWKDAEKGSRSLKRKRADVIVISDTPILFTSALKVPKLKIATPG